MRIFTLAMTLVPLVVGSAHAGMMGLGGPFGGFHRGHGGGELGGLHNIETTYDMFADTFSDLMTEYDTGLTGIEDYYDSEEYTEVVSEVDLLSERYDYFLDKVGLTVDWLDNHLTHLSDEVTFWDELLAEYQANGELSAERLERIETWITTIQDILGLKLDYLTEKQSVLEENYATYTTFGEEIDAYLDTIVSAGGGDTDSDSTDTTNTDSTVGAIAAMAAPADMTVEECHMQLSNVTAVPEPAGAILAASVTLGVMSRRCRPNS